VNEFMEKKVRLEWHRQNKSYDVVIIGGGGHGLSAAYYLATRHGTTNVCVLERKYIGGGNSGRNTTIIRSNYGVPEAIEFYQRSLELYHGLEAETDRWLMHKPKGLLWLAHGEMASRGQFARCALNREYGADSEYVTPREIKELVPEIDLTGGGRYPVTGATYHKSGATARHDRVNWALAEGANRLGVHIHQRTEVTGLKVKNGRIEGVETNQGPISCGTVLCAVGGHVSRVAAMAGFQVPIRTHPLQAYVTSHYERSFHPIVASSSLLCYVSQTARGEMLMGAEIDRQPSYNYRANQKLIQSCSHRVLTILPFMRKLKVLRHWTGVCDMSPDYSPIMGPTPVENLLITTGWGTWGFKAIPAGGEAMAELIATGKIPRLIRPFALDRFALDRTKADRGSAGTH
jgi:sarcosine oxidase, subunit beta